MQGSLFPGQFHYFYGGALTRGKRKTLRPLARNRPIHFVMKAGKPMLFKNRNLVASELRRLANQFGVRLYATAVNFDHIHFAAVIPGRKEYTGFIRSFTGLLARKLGKGLWKLLPFSRVLTWGKDFRQTQVYIRKNREEAEGLRPYEPRKNFYARFLRGG